MKSVFIAYHDINTEARSQEMCNLLKLYGDVIAVSYTNYIADGIHSVFNHAEKKSLFNFLYNAWNTIKKEQPDIIILHDAYPMIFAAYIKRKYPMMIIIHDSSELYLHEEKAIGKITIKSRIAKFFLLILKKNIHFADVIVAANDERAQIMVRYYNLKDKPLIFDNIHKIECSYNLEECEQKFARILMEKRNIIYAGGISEKRMTYKLAEQIGRLALDNIQLIVVGSKEKNGEEKLKKLLKSKEIKNVIYLGFVSREELKYLIERSLMTISVFAMDTFNNINCASGKVYEGLFLGKPLLAGINPPLKHLCEEYNVGVSTDRFDKGCIQILENYDYYVGQVKKYVAELDYDHRIEKLKKDIDKKLNIKQCGYNNPSIEKSKLL